MSMGAIIPGQGGLVTGTAAPSAKLRPLRNPLYDTEVFTVASTFNQMEYFINRRTFQNLPAIAKGFADTNMPNDGGTLGNPLQFDLFGFNSYMNPDAQLDDVNLVENLGVFRFFFGVDTPWLTTRYSHIPCGVYRQGFTTIAAQALTTKGVPTANNFFNFTNLKKQARRIHSNETFRVRLEWGQRGGGVPVPNAQLFITVVLLGILYASL